MRETVNSLSILVFIGIMFLFSHLLKFKHVFYFTMNELYQPLVMKIVANAKLILLIRFEGLIHTNCSLEFLEFIVQDVWNNLVLKCSCEINCLGYGES